MPTTGIFSRTLYALMFIFIAGAAMLLLQSCHDEEVTTTEETEETPEDPDFDPVAYDSTFTHAVVVTYADATARVTNPFENAGVSVSITQGHVVVNATITETEVTYVLTGKATAGSFKLYSDYKCTVLLNGVALTNSNGPAINIQSGKKISVNVLTGSKNRLADGPDYTTSNEDQKGTFFSEGQLIFSGNGSLTVVGKYKHAICSDDYISVTQGNLNINQAVSDGIHANDYFKMTGGSVTVNASGDGIDCEEGYIVLSGGILQVNSVDDGITAGNEAGTPYINITGGTIQVTTTGTKGHAIASEGDITINSPSPIQLNVAGKASKGFKSAGNFSLVQGNLSITTTGDAFFDTEDGEVATAAGINCKGNLMMSGGNLTITSSGSAGKGISVSGSTTIKGGTASIHASGVDFTYLDNTHEAKAIKGDGTIFFQDGDLTLAAKDDAIKSEGSIQIDGGTINITESTEGIEAPFITINGGAIQVTASDDGVNATHGGGEARVDDGSLLTVNGGTLLLNVSIGDGIDSNGKVVMTGGTVIIQGPPNPPEVAIDYNGTFNMSGGYLLASGPEGPFIQGTSATSTQYTALIALTGNLSSHTLIHIQDANGNSLATYEPARKTYYFVLSTPALQRNSTYKVYTGGRVTGGTTQNGLTTGGTYSGGTLRGSFTMNNVLTAVTL